MTPPLTLKARDRQIRTAKSLLYRALEAGLPEPLATDVATFLGTPSWRFEYPVSIHSTAQAKVPASERPS